MLHVVPILMENNHWQRNGPAERIEQTITTGSQYKGAGHLLDWEIHMLDIDVCKNAHVLLSKISARLSI